MKIYLADVPFNTIYSYIIKKPEIMINLLLAFGSDALEDFLNRQHLNINKFFLSLFLDCGAFSLNSGKKDPHKNRYIHNENYIRFNKRSGHIFPLRSSLDEDFSPDGIMTNLINLHEMEKAGFTPLPVVHDIYGEEIDIFIERGCKYICLGSALVNNNKTMEFLMKKVAGTGIKIHIFGRISFKQLTTYPIYSCDSTGWANKVSKGNVCWWNPEKKGLNKTEAFHISKFGKDEENNIYEHPWKEQFRKFLRDELNIDYEAFLSNTVLQQIVNIHYFVTLEREINKIQREKGFFTAE